MVHWAQHRQKTCPQVWAAAPSQAPACPQGNPAEPACLAKQASPRLPHRWPASLVRRSYPPAWTCLPAARHSSQILPPALVAAAPGAYPLTTRLSRHATHRHRPEASLAHEASLCQCPLDGLPQDRPAKAQRRQRQALAATRRATVRSTNRRLRRDWRPRWSSRCQTKRAPAASRDAAWRSRRSPSVLSIGSQARQPASATPKGARGGHTRQVQPATCLPPPPRPRPSPPPSRACRRAAPSQVRAEARPKAPQATRPTNQPRTHRLEAAPPARAGKPRLCLAAPCVAPCRKRASAPPLRRIPQPGPACSLHALLESRRQARRPLGVANRPHSAPSDDSPSRQATHSRQPPPPREDAHQVARHDVKRCHIELYVADRTSTSGRAPLPPAAATPAPRRASAIAGESGRRAARQPAEPAQVRRWPAAECLIAHSSWVHARPASRAVRGRGCGCWTSVRSLFRGGKSVPQTPTTCPQTPAVFAETDSGRRGRNPPPSLH